MINLITDRTEKAVYLDGELSSLELELADRTGVTSEDWIFFSEKWYEQELAKAEKFRAAEADFLKNPDTTVINWSEEIPTLIIADSLTTLMHEIPLLAHEAELGVSFYEDLACEIEHLQQTVFEEENLGDDEQHESKILEAKI